MSVRFCLLLLLSVQLVREGDGVITGPRSRRELGQVEPRTIEVEAREDLLLRNKEKRLHKRQSPSTTSGIGTTAHLTGDGHNQAVVHWTGYPSERIFIVTRARIGYAGGKQAHSRESWLWRSTDYGQTFVNETNKLDSDAVIEWYYISPRQSNLIFADRGNRRLYVTRDEGDTYTRYDIPFTPDNLRFQSVYAPHSNDSDLSQHVLGYDATNQTLWLSSNLGAHWTLLGMNVTDGRYYWRVMNAPFEDLTAVYFETTINSTHAELHHSVRPYTTHNVFDSSLGPFLNHTFVLTHEYMLVQKSASVGRGYQSPLWVSYYRRPFRQARFPLQTVERHYSVVDASEGQVFIAVYHSFNNTNLYLSEEQGLNYSLSLEYIISPPESSWDNPTFDVHVVEGIVGTYIANCKTPGSQYGATVISFDKGGTWNLLTPPAGAVTTSGTVCVPPVCSLHLHMDSDRVNGYQSILSQDSAIGLIIALGNLGSALQRGYSSRSVQLYFSRDGGFTWQEVSQGFWEFQFAALGSIIVTVPKWTRTNYVKWSCDEGASWNTTSFVNSNILVVGMLTERGEKARHVTVFGSTNFSSGFYWMVIDLNFTDVVPDECSFPDDYFQWIPTDERPGSRCLLGEVITYERRQSGACCYVDPEYDKPISRTPCVCAIEDFECDFGFERVNLNSPCTPLPYLSWPPLPPTNCPEQSNYTYTSGYRKVAGDRCVPGDEAYFLPITRPCPIRTGPCPIRAPQRLFISHPPVITPGESVTFNLTQLLGGRLSTHYIWYFGDGSKIVNITGYDNGRSQVHTFQRPGTYHVNVTATNSGGTSQAFSVVSVLENITAMDVLINKTVGVLELLQASVSVLAGQAVYTGPLNVTVWDQKGVLLPSSICPRNSLGSVVHVELSLSQPGNTTITFQAANGVSSASMAIELLVVDRLTGVSFILPDQYYDISAIPAKVILLFHSTLSTQYNTTIYGSVHYDWDFGDRTSLSKTNDPAVSHTYTQPGYFQLTLTVHGFSSTVRNVTTLRVYQAIQSSSAVIASDGVINSKFVHVGKNISLKVQPRTASQEVPLDTVFTWHVLGVGGECTTYVGNLTYSFPEEGHYNISVTGVHSVGNFTAQLRLIAEENITAMDVFINKTVGVLELLQASVLVLAGQTVYTGPLNVMVWDLKGVLLSSSIYPRNSLGSVVHVELSLSQPGNTTVTFQAANGVSSASMAVELLVVDRLTGVSFILPDQYYDISAIPAKVTLLFHSTLSTQYNTTIYGSVHYDWDFGDRTSLSKTNDPAVSHTYTQPGYFQLTLTVHGFSSAVRNVTTLRVYQSIQSSSAVIASDGVINSKFVHVGKNISLKVQPRTASQEVPLDTVFTWHVLGPGGECTTYVGNLTYSFPEEGHYNISVTGVHSVGNFTAQLRLIAEADISDLQVHTVPTVRTYTSTTVNVTVQQENTSAGYTGPLNLSAWDKNSTRLAGWHKDSVSGDEALQLEVQLSRPGDTSVTFRASNDVSVVTKDSHMVVVGSGQYGGLVMFFDTTRLPANHNTPEWHSKLKNSIIGYINQTRHIPTRLVEVLFDHFRYTSAELPTFLSGELRRRSVELAPSADVYVLPASYTKKDFNATLEVAALIVGEAEKGRLQFMVDGHVVVVLEAYLLPLTHFVSPPQPPQHLDTNLSLGLGLGLGLGMVAMVTLLVATTCFFHRKYRCLHVRYSRLQRSPAPSFSVEEEDVADNLSDDEPLYRDSHRMGTLQFLQDDIEL